MLTNSDQVNSGKCTHVLCFRELKQCCQLFVCTCQCISSKAWQRWWQLWLSYFRKSFSWLFLLIFIYLFTDSYWSALFFFLHVAVPLWAHMFRPSGGEVATVPHLCVHSALKLVWLQARQVCVCACTKACMHESLFALAFSVLMAQHASVSSCIVNPEQCNSLVTVA